MAPPLHTFELPNCATRVSGTQINLVVNFDNVFQLALALQRNEYSGAGADICTNL